MATAPFWFSSMEHPSTALMPFWFSADDFISLQILFEGRKGSGFQGDIAIDDIMFFRQPCEGFPIASTCTFEQGLDFCGFRIERTAENKGWKWYDAFATETPPIPTGWLVFGLGLYTVHRRTQDISGEVAKARK